MSHPFTADYIRMAAASRELQSVRMQSKIFQAGDFVIFESSYTPAGMVSMIDERSGNIPQDNAQVWLPQLHQLMELFGDFPASLQAMRGGLSTGTGAPHGYFESFRSWEECTLAVLMLTQGCLWNGTGWVRAAPSNG